MGDVLSSIGTGAKDVFSGVGNAVGTGLGDVGQFLGDIGSGIGGFHGATATPGISPSGVASLFPGPAATPGIAGIASPGAASGASAAAFGASPGDVAGGGVGGFDPSTVSLPGPDVSYNASPINIPGVGAAGAGATPAAGGGSNFLSKLFSDPTKLASLGILGYDVAQGSKTPAEVKQLQALQTQEQGIANNETALAEGGQNGQLTAGASAMLNQNLASNQAAIRAHYASMGMSGSSAEQEDLAAAQQSNLAQRFQLGQQLAQTGFSEASAASGESSSLLQAILQQETAQGSELGNLLAEFAGAAIRPDVKPAAAAA